MSPSVSVLSVSTRSCQRGCLAASVRTPDTPAWLRTLCPRACNLAPACRSDYIASNHQPTNQQPLSYWSSHLGASCNVSSALAASDWIWDIPDYRVSLTEQSVILIFTDFQNPDSFGQRWKCDFILLSLGYRPTSLGVVLYKMACPR